MKVDKEAVKEPLGGGQNPWCEECLSGNYLKRLWSPNVTFGTHKLNLPVQTHISGMPCNIGGRGVMKDAKVSPLPQECNSKKIILYQKTLTRMVHEKPATAILYYC